MKNFIVFFLLSLLAVGCVAVQPEPSLTPSPIPLTFTASPIPTATITLTPTSTPYPTPILPVKFQTPLPISIHPITSKNLFQLREIARYDPQENGPWIKPRIPHTLEFLEDGSLTFHQRDDSLRNVTCIIKQVGQVECMEDVLVGTDGKFYSYATENFHIDIWAGLLTTGDPNFSLRWRGYGVSVDALDPFHQVLFYTSRSVGGNVSLSNTVIKEIGDSHDTIAEWPGSEIEKVVFSGNKEVAVICRRPGGVLYFSEVYRDKLAVIDLAGRKVVAQQPFTCFYVPIALSKDGSQMASAHAFSEVVGGQERIKYDLLMTNTMPPQDRKTFDIKCDRFNAIAYSPDETMLVVACDDGTLRFIDTETIAELHRIKVDPDLWRASFSADGARLATASRSGIINIWAVPPFEYPLPDPSRSSSSVETISQSSPYVWEFNISGDTEGWVALNQLTTLKTSDGFLSTKATGNDPYMLSPELNADAASMTHLEIRMSTSAGNNGELYFITTTDPIFDETKVIRFPVIGDGKFHVYTIDMSETEIWKGVITQIRLDPVVTPADIQIDSVKLLPR